MMGQRARRKRHYAVLCAFSVSDPRLFLARRLPAAENVPAPCMYSQTYYQPTSAIASFERLCLALLRTRLNTSTPVPFTGVTQR